MRFSRPLFVTCSALAGLSLSACAQEEGNAAPESAETGSEGETAENASEQNESVVMTDTGWLTVGTDGAVQTTFFDANGRYRDLRNGELFATGGWEQRPDSRICFEPDAGLGACWETGGEDTGGTVIATNGEGKSIELKRVTYLAEIVPEDEELEEQEGAGG